MYHNVKFWISFSVREECTIPIVTNAVIAPNRTSYYHFQEVKIICEEGFLLNTSIVGVNFVPAISAFCIRHTVSIWTEGVDSISDIGIVGCFRMYHESTNWSAVPHYDDVIMTMLASQITSLAVVYSIVYSGVDQRKHQSSASLAFVREIHRGPVNFPQKWPVTRKIFPFDDVIMIITRSIITMTPHRASWSNHQQLDCLFALAKIKETSKLHVSDPLWGEFTCDRWIPHTKGQ